jgi:hypothetical protein
MGNGGRAPLRRLAPAARLRRSLRPSLTACALHALICWHNYNKGGRDCRSPRWDNRGALQCTASQSHGVPRLGLEWTAERAAMDAFRETGRLLIVLGLVLAGVGALLAWSGKLPFRLGRLPGDIVYQGRNGSFYFPVVTCILLSLVLSLLIWAANHFRR